MYGMIPSAKTRDARQRAAGEQVQEVEDAAAAELLLDGA